MSAISSMNISGTKTVETYQRSQYSLVFFSQIYVLLVEILNLMLIITSRYNNFNERMIYNSNSNINVVNIARLKFSIEVWLK